jgi:hypothetical protein
MKKKLIYHLYIGEDFESNEAYDLHFHCLKYFINVFDKIDFTICIDKELRKYFLLKAYNWINNLEFSGEIIINVVDNTNLREAKTFKDKVVDANNSKEYVFFAHSKGISNLRNENINKESVITWILAMYFYNLNFIKELENIFSGENRRPEIFYGAPLVIFDRDAYPVYGHKSCIEYSGTFFWTNGPRFYNGKITGAFPDIVFGGRDFAEQYPGFFCDRKIYGQGLSSHNDVALDGHSFDFYNLDLHQWDYVIEILGNKEEFKDFVNKIKNNI